MLCGDVTTVTFFRRFDSFSRIGAASLLQSAIDTHPGVPPPQWLVVHQLGASAESSCSGKSNTTFHVDYMTQFRQTPACLHASSKPSLI